jgi:hypothetical protein
MKSITIVGKSKAAINLSYYLKSIHIKHNFTGYHDFKKHLDLIKNSEILFILTRDDEILNFYKKNLKLLKGKKLYHFSGVLFSKNITSLHPVTSFSDNPLSKKDFEKIIFTSESPLKVKKELKWFRNKIIKINPADKPYYHCLLNILFNFPPLIFKSVSDELTNKFNIPEKYINQNIIKIVKRYIDNPYFSGGPFVRGDKRTIEAHLKSLKGKKIFYIYDGFLKFYHQKYKRNTR